MVARKVFSFLTREQEAAVLAACSPVRTRAGSLLVRKGELSRDLYIITDGEYKVFDDERGEDLVLALLHRGDIFGEMSFLDGEPRSASVRAAVDGSALKIGHDELPGLMSRSPDTALALVLGLARIVTYRLRIADDALSLSMEENQEEVDQDELQRLIDEMHLAVHIELSEDL